ncbi:MAG: cryptochrome/photolyase family protein [Rhodospirillaceae bacterium]|nr:cryptochrome/photolyase family protein [Rhodospirillaceae bacterium]
MHHHRSLILILGNHLTLNVTSLRAGNPASDTVLMAEVTEEMEFVPHHKKKVAFLFSAMRHFGSELAKRGWRLRYVKLDDPGNTNSLCGEVARALKESPAKRVLLTEPAEYRLKAAFLDWAKNNDSEIQILEDDRFICSHQEFRGWAKGRNQLRMEYFYREMRRKTGLLMDGNKPEGGRWNYDSDNRKPPKGDLHAPGPYRSMPDSTTKEVLSLVGSRLGKNFGSLESFWFSVTRTDAMKALDQFIDHSLPNFGDYQDAMLEGEPFLYHSVLAQYINAGLLNPLEVCQKVELSYYSGHAPLNAVEGYIRQIIGWREYIRGIYWLKMPGYTEQNFLEATRDLPDFYWTADTDMACMAAAIKQTRDEAYAHHIQRLMITGNFAMLAGINPYQVHEWYLAVYADAYEWVEAPNVIGMSQFADGGFLSSKPYAASGNYINKMSDHCRGCMYDVKQKIGPEACPFNSLYWDFLIRNEEKLRGNHRLRRAYKMWDRMDDQKKLEYRATALNVLNAL